MDIERFKRLPVMGILRGGDVAAVEPLVECVIEAGLETLEITMNTPDAPAMLARLREVAGERLTIGAGTVLDRDDLDRALDAGATFIVSPVLVHDVVEQCAARSVPVFPGAFTPQEIFDADRAGATMVKVFPAKFFGPSYFAEIRGPFADARLLACGGVSPKNMAAFFDAGAAAVAFGGSVFKPEWIAEGRFDRIADGVRELVSAYRSTER